MISIEVTKKRLLSGAEKNCGCERFTTNQELDRTGAVAGPKMNKGEYTTSGCAPLCG